MSVCHNLAFDLILCRVATHGRYRHRYVLGYDEFGRRKGKTEICQPDPGLSLGNLSGHSLPCHDASCRALLLRKVRVRAAQSIVIDVIIR